MRLLISQRSILVIVLTIFSSSVYAANGIDILDLSTKVVEQKILIECDMKYALDDRIKEALRNGIKMSFLLEIELRQDNTYWLDPVINKLQKEFRVKYHALSKQYILVETDSEKERSFSDLYSAFYYLSRIRDVELGSINGLNVENEYYIRARVRLVTEELPLPLRIKSYVSSSWRPASGWTLWPM